MDFPQENVDAVIIGTGLVESIAAAALARIGKSVLHLDKDTYYGGSWATYTLRDVERWIAEHQADSKTDGAAADGLDSIELSDGEAMFRLVDCIEDGIQNVVSWASSNEQAEPDSLPEADRAQADNLAEKGVAGGSNTELPSKSTDAKVPDSAKTEDSAEVESRSEVSQGDASPVDGSRDAEQSAALPPSVSSAAVSGQTNNDDEVTPAGRQQQAEGADTERLTWDRLKEKSRYFNFDLCPRLLFTRGDMVELLIKSKVSRYLEFRGIAKTLAWLGDQIVEVPCSHADVFNSKLLSLIEKNVIKRFLTFCLNYDNHPEVYSGYEDRPFEDFLQAWPSGRKPQLSSNLRCIVLHCIAMTSGSTPTVEALKATQFFLKSIGRYSNNTPFLWPVYGCGELPQAFCRMSAVFGGIYMLQRDVTALVLSDNNKQCTGVVCSEGGRVNCQWLVMSTSSCPQSWAKHGTRRNVARGIFVTNRSLVQADEAQLLLLTVPPSDELSLPHIVQVIELPSISQACPTGCFVVHLTALSTGTPAEELFSPLLSRLFRKPSSLSRSLETDDHRPRMLWSLFYNHVVEEVEPVIDDSRLDNVLVAPGPDHSLGLGGAVKAAQDIFERICPGEEFLPPAPEPEDIVYESSNPGPEGNKEETGAGQLTNEGEKPTALDNTQEEVNCDGEKAASEDNGQSQVNESEPSNEMGVSGSGDTST